MIWEELDRQLEELAHQRLLRSKKTLASPCGTSAVIAGKTCLSFSSNDYLGLAAHEKLIDAVRLSAGKWGIGSGGSHVVNGHKVPHENLETALAGFVGAERALFYSTGYMANVGVVPALVGRGDAVFGDRLNHASLIDGVLLSRADHHRYAHNDMIRLEKMLKASTAKRKLIVSDAVFSMDGDQAPLKELFALAERYDAWLVVDDAHGFGVLGREGHGSLDHQGLPFHPRLIYVGTLGKAAGVSGAFVAGSKAVVEWLIQRSRPYIFTTATSPVLASAILAALELIRNGDTLRARLHSLIARLKTGLDETGWQLLPSATAIQPILVGENATALRVSEKLLERGIWVPAIRPPTVPKGRARLRVSLSAAHTEENIDQLINALKEIE